LSAIGNDISAPMIGPSLPQLRIIAPSVSGSLANADADSRGNSCSELSLPASFGILFGDNAAPFQLAHRVSCEGRSLGQPAFKTFMGFRSDFRHGVRNVLYETA
jgi:hypothetical protein